MRRFLILSSVILGMSVCGLASAQAQTAAQQIAQPAPQQAGQPAPQVTQQVPQQATAPAQTQSQTPNQYQAAPAAVAPATTAPAPAVASPTAAPTAAATPTPTAATPAVTAPAASAPIATAPTAAPEVAAPVTGTQGVAAPQPAAVASPKQYANLKLDESKYVDPTFANLAKLYWALGILDINDNQIIDSYLSITDCDLYTNYLNDDLEWRNIRELARQSIRKNYKSFPTHFRVMIPLYLRQYHVEEEYFDVDMDKSALKAVRKIEALFYNNPITCRRVGEIEGFPRNLILFLNRPFTLAEVPVERELARIFLDEINSHKKYLSPTQRASEGERQAYLEIFFRVHSFKETVHGLPGIQAVVFTQIDHLRVFADYQKDKLLFERSMFEDSGRKRFKRKGPVTEEELNLPEGPIFENKKNAKDNK